MQATFDHAAFVAELERARAERGMSLRQVATEAGLEPSTLQRIVNGSVPDLPRFALLLDWLSVPADQFIRRASGRLDLQLGTGEVIEIKRASETVLSPQQRRHLKAAVEQIVRAIDA